MHCLSLNAQSLRKIALILAFFLTACADSNDKIGSTVKGTRIEILERTKEIKADTDLQESPPLLPDIIHNKEWPTTGYDTTHILPNADIAVHPQQIWQEDIGEGSSSDFKLLARPVISQGIVFTIDAQGLVSALDATTGDKKWEFDTTPPERDEKAIAGGLAVNDTTLYATTGFGEVLALNTQNGEVKWRHLLLNPLRAAPTVANGRVYVVSIDNELQALDTQTGDILWHHNGISENATLMGASSPAVIGESVVVAYSSGELFNLRSENGRVLWNYALTTPTQVGALPAIADIRGLPVISHGNIFAISHNGRMASIDERTGDRAWETDVGGINTPLVTDDTIFVLSTEDKLIAIERSSGRIKWVHDLQHLADPTDHDSDHVYWSGPIFGHNELWLTNSLGQVVSFSPNKGSIIDTITLDDPIYIPPVIAQDMMYVMTDNGKLIALR